MVIIIATKFQIIILTAAEGIFKYALAPTENSNYIDSISTTFFKQYDQLHCNDQ